MKYFGVSDIHGSEYYAEKLIELYKKEKADKILLLGDVLYHGPRNDLPKGYGPKGVIKILNEYKKDIICIKGNCDAEVDQMVLDFPIMNDHIILKDPYHTIYMCHGHHENNDNPPLMNEDYILLCGHTHIPCFDIHNDYIYMNPGSISIPKNNSYHGYMLIEDEEIIWKDIDGNVKDKLIYKKRF